MLKLWQLWWEYQNFDLLCQKVQNCENNNKWHRWNQGFSRFCSAFFKFGGFFWPHVHFPGFSKFSVFQGFLATLYIYTSQENFLSSSKKRERRILPQFPSFYSNILSMVAGEKLGKAFSPKLIEHPYFQPNFRYVT